MTAPRVIIAPLHRVQRGHGQRFVAARPRGPVRRPARVALMLALAQAIHAAIHGGQVADQADAARRLGYTRARLTQLLDLRLLAPDLQERVLFLEAVNGVEPLTERSLRSLVKQPLWVDQRTLFARFALGAHQAMPSATSGTLPRRPREEARLST